MSTRSNIGYKIKEGEQKGKYAFVYCHFDGYPSGTGLTLKNHYNSYEEMLDLVQCGNMSYPGVPYTSMNEKIEDMKPKVVDCVNKTHQQEYSYIWEDDKLIYSSNGKDWEDL